MSTMAFDFYNSAGARLSGALETPEAKPRGWAIFAHCFTCGKNALAAVRVSRGLAQAGIGVLRFDFAGLGESDGEFHQTDFASNVGDIVSAAEALTARGMAPDLLVGHSLGGSASIAAASLIPSTRAVATISAPYDAAHILDLLKPDVLAEIAATGRAAVKLGARCFEITHRLVDDVKAQDQRSRLHDLGLPLLVLHAAGDDIVGIENATQIFSAAQHPKSFVSLDMADHLLTDPDDAAYVAAVIASWGRRYLKQEAVPLGLSGDGSVTAEETGAGLFQLRVQAGDAVFLSDEPVSVGGLGSGATPYELLSAGLAACTTMTLRVYANRKGIPVDRIRTCVGYTKDAGSERPDRFHRKIDAQGDLSEHHLQELLRIADRCPVHLTLERGSRITTELGEPPAEASAAVVHALEVEQLASGS